LLRRNDETPRRRCFVGLPIGFVERVHDELAIDSHGVFRTFLEEHQPAAEASLRRLTGRVQHRIGPGGDQAHRNFRIGLLRFDAESAFNVPFGKLPALGLAGAAGVGGDGKHQ
jgi:hypothetical protein